MRIHAAGSLAEKIQDESTQSVSDCKQYSHNPPLLLSKRTDKNTAINEIISIARANEGIVSRDIAAQIVTELEGYPAPELDDVLALIDKWTRTPYLYNDSEIEELADKVDHFILEAIAEDTDENCLFRALNGFHRADAAAEAMKQHVFQDTQKRVVEVLLTKNIFKSCLPKVAATFRAARIQEIQQIAKKEGIIIGENEALIVYHGIGVYDEKIYEEDVLKKIRLMFPDYFQELKQRMLTKSEYHKLLNQCFKAYRGGDQMLQDRFENVLYHNSEWAELPADGDWFDAEFILSPEDAAYMIKTLAKHAIFSAAEKEMMTTLILQSVKQEIRIGGVE